ncbi:MAG: helix-turn-helix transcriptional regulator [Clostridia bacterium]|nr:helix-turn-helix transcriptional regulator [Clostridia bacterium]
MTICEKKEHEQAVGSAKREALSEEQLGRVCNVFRVLGEPSRMKIVLALTGGEMCVYHILQAVGGTQSGVSHQLRVLKDNRIVRSRREGQNILYSLADDHIVEIVAMGRAHMDCAEE